MTERIRLEPVQLGGIKNIVSNHITRFSDKDNPLSLKTPALARKVNIISDVKHQYPNRGEEALVRRIVNERSLPLKHYQDALHMYEGFLIENLIPIISPDIDAEKLRDNLDNFITWELYYHMFPIYLRKRIQKAQQMLEDVRGGFVVKPRNKQATQDFREREIQEFTDALDIFHEIVQPRIEEILVANNTT